MWLLYFQIPSKPEAETIHKMGAGEPDIMTWFPRREDYEDAPVAIMPDETIEEKVDRQVVSAFGEIRFRNLGYQICRNI